jgi:hypothetical protein
MPDLEMSIPQGHTRKERQMNPIIEKVARAVYDGLEEADPSAFIGTFKTDRDVTIDGKFSLPTVARAAIRATLEHLRDNVSEGMVETCNEQIGYMGDGDVNTDSLENGIRAIFSQAIAELDA